MSSECELLSNCGFFNKYRSVNELACKWFIKEYCLGTKQNECQRKEYLRQNNEMPDDDLMPNGQIAKK